MHKICKNSYRTVFIIERSVPKVNILNYANSNDTKISVFKYSAYKKYGDRFEN